MTTVSAVSSVAERLDNLLLADGAPARCVGDLRDGVVHLRRDLDLMETELASATNDFSREVKQRATQLAYDIEDAVESYARGQAAAESRWKLGGALQCLLKYPTARSLRKDLHMFKRRIEELKNLMGPERDAAKGERSGGSNTLSIVEPQHHRHNDDAPVVVGEDVERLRSLLLGGESKLSVIAICGMGGIGKTTLARLLYNDLLVTTHFQIRAWATVSQKFDARDILGTILFSLSPGWSKYEISGMETMGLMEQLYKAQKGRRYLVVLDDVWSSEAWETLRFAYPDDDNGSRIVITTRNVDVVHSMSSPIILEMRLLSDDESWEILKLKSGLLDDPGMQVIDPEIATIGRRIARYCGGNVLSIAVIGSALRTKNLEEWKKMERLLREPERSLTSMDSVLGLSYNHLPPHLKPCFLCLGYFPSNEPIPVEKLYLLWMAEGLISVRGSNDKAQIKAAEEYFNELVHRSLVIVVENEEVSAFTRSRSCELHDLVRDFCIWRGEEEEFFKVTYGHGDKISTSTRRIAICLNTNDDVRLNISEAKHIRSILFFDKDESLPKPTGPRQVSDLTEFQWTRVLGFDGVDFRVKMLPRGIRKLIYLRNLSFHGCYLQEFPSSFSNFPFLETLDLRVRVHCIMTIPNILRKISSLRHLYLPVAFRVDTKDKLKLDTLKKLEILENFNPGLCDAEDLLQLENLQILTGMVDGNNVDLKNTISCMNKNKFLSHSSLVVKNFDSYSKERLSIVAALLECNALHCLDIEGYLGVTLLHEGIASNFTSMVFDGSEFSEDPMPILGKLPNLRNVVLCNDAFVGTKMVCSGLDSFPQLESLKLATLQCLEEWEVEGAMQKLTSITIEQCNTLEVLPYGLSEIWTLRVFMIGSMPEEFQDSVKEMIKEQRDLGNEELTITFYDC